MDYKEEYQKALERAKKGLPIDEVFPELKESEDERIRKELIEAIEEARVFDIDKEVADRWIAYLEKQKEQKPAEKPSMLKKLKEHLANTPQEQLDAEFEALKDLTIDKPAEWSEDDEKMARFIGNAITTDEASKYLEEKNIKIIDAHVWLEQKLKSLRPSFRPSEEQMDALLWCTAHLGGADHRVLAELYEHLKMYCL